MAARRELLSFLICSGLALLITLVPAAIRDDDSTIEGPSIEDFIRDLSMDPRFDRYSEDSVRFLRLVLDQYLRSHRDDGNPVVIRAMKRNNSGVPSDWNIRVNPIPEGRGYEIQIRTVDGLTLNGSVYIAIPM